MRTAFSEVRKRGKTRGTRCSNIPKSEPFRAIMRPPDPEKPFLPLLLPLLLRKDSTPCRCSTKPEFLQFFLTFLTIPQPCVALRRTHATARRSAPVPATRALLQPQRIRLSCARRGGSHNGTA